MKHLIIAIITILTSSMCVMAQTRSEQIYEASDYGIVPNKGKNTSPLMDKLIKKVQKEQKAGTKSIIRLKPGRYDFHETGAAQRTYYISNHDQTNPKRVGIALEEMSNFILDGQGAQLVFHGRMLPISLVRSQDCSIQNLSIDFEHPHIAQVKVVENNPEKGILFQPAPWVDYKVVKGEFINCGEGWEMKYSFGIPFDGDTRHVMYNTGDTRCNINEVTEEKPGLIRAPHWKDNRLKAGSIMVLRSWERPAPAIFMSHDTNTCIERVKVHYAEGMGLLAQLCEDITLTGFGVCLKGVDDPRFFTTQADATHFSGCKGKIISQDGLYEGMMDDAINVHGTYLRIMKRMDNHTVIGRYMHDQSWGFEWGRKGDQVQFIRSNTMDILPDTCTITDIKPYDKETTDGAREFIITLDKEIPQRVKAEEGYGVENLSWAPEVLFARNTIRNNRARGALFSTPQPVIVEDNFFDHTSGTAILLCGDCNGWYETGACRDVTIRRNRFVNALTSQYQFTSAIISIYPEIPNLRGQEGFFHGGNGKGIVIEDNEFDTFDKPILYAKSVDGLWFRNNTIRTNRSFPAFHPNKDRFLLERVTNAHISE